MKALVVYATITGNNEEIANIIVDALRAKNVEVVKSEMSQTDVSEFEDVDICVVCAYTYDEGALPEEGLDFYEELQTSDLKGKTFGVAGSGDVFYGDDFNKAVDEFEAAFKKTGATQGSSSVKIDLEPYEEDIETLQGFVSELIKTTSSKTV
ncbi:flavodoxin nitric oxide synthase [Furfurilactobacillus siliginis]|uniref:Flavodoxin n=2 Tax=Furfurilactobacillus siliginis TaxID=348151 RepID=A0A0R2L440_9LACO|nr:flavodoxin nitric oxide synthase [Furfurilactobacillus siliginis]GEK27899.1 flavodoxin [Furfurilactobacillus siliginis]